MAKHRNWTRDETMMAMCLYCSLPFGKMHSGNADVIELARQIDRTPSSVAMKLGNFASLDPTHKARGVGGLPNTTTLDREVWSEFQRDWEQAAYEGRQIHDRFTKSQSVENSDASRGTEDYEAAFESRSSEATDAIRLTRIRIGQDFFRKAVLSSYEWQCCVSGVRESGLLVASHILPWSAFPEHRVNPSNGLCLSRLHDAAFDRGLITFDEDFKLVVGNQIKSQFDNPMIQAAFSVYEGKQIKLPHKFGPLRSFMERHRTEIFVL